MLDRNEDHGGTPASFRQRQCNTLLALIGHSARQLRAKQETDTKLLDVISTLLEMTSPGENTTESVDLLAAIRWALTEALLTISAVDFAKVVLTSKPSSPETPDIPEISTGAFVLPNAPIPDEAKLTNYIMPGK